MHDLQLRCRLHYHHTVCVPAERFLFRHLDVRLGVRPRDSFLDECAPNVRCQLASWSMRRPVRPPGLPGGAISLRNAVSIATGLVRTISTPFSATPAALTLTPAANLAANKRIIGG